MNTSEHRFLFFCAVCLFLAGFTVWWWLPPLMDLLGVETLVGGWK